MSSQSLTVLAKCASKSYKFHSALAAWQEGLCKPGGIKLPSSRIGFYLDDDNSHGNSDEFQ